MATAEFRFDAGANLLSYALPDYRNVLSPMKPGASITVTRGQAMGTKTSDGKQYPLNLAATDGTQSFSGFAQFTFSTDSSGNVFLKVADTAGTPNYLAVPMNYANMWTSGVFDPTDLSTAPDSGTSTAEVDTITPTSPTTGDIYTVEAPNGAIASFTVGATQTATATVTGLKNAWNADPRLVAIATPTGTATLILTAVNKGVAMGLVATAVGTGTTALVVTTPAVAVDVSEVDTFTFAGTIATADVYTATITYGGLQTRTISFTVAGTTTATAVSNGLRAAWNADPYFSQYATVSGTATLIATNNVPGSLSNIAITSSGAGTITKVVTTPALGKNIADIQASRPGCYVLSPYGFWVIN